MGMLVEGQWQDQTPASDGRVATANGEFIRPESAYRHVVGVAESEFTPESNRYHLFANAGCPWAYRALLYRQLKGLGPHIGLSLTRPAAGAQGWTFGETPEALLGATHMHQVYTAADSKFTGRCTVPVLWDKKQGTIVNNESADIIRVFNSAFDALPGVVAADFYPAALRPKIDAWNDKIYASINNGVYRCGFARSQQAYEAAYDALFAQLDEIDAHLARHRFLCGATVTEADWRLFSTLVRFDLAYHGQFRCNRSRLVDFVHLWPYTRDLYQYPGVAQTVDIAAIKEIYYGSRAPGILPKGPLVDFGAESGRSELAG